MKRLIIMLGFLLLLNGSLITAAAEQAPILNKPSTVTAAPAVSNTNKINYKTELKKLGFFNDESRDSALNLRNAVIRFQSSCNIAVTGVWDKKCLSMLAERLQTGVADCEDIVAAPPVSGKWISINKTKRILTLYEGDKAVQKYPVAVGNPPSRTPEGKYTIVSKVINPSWGGGGYAKPVKGGVPENPLGYRWLGLSYKNGSTLGIHGNNSPYSIGKNVSHGCIRMINSDVTQLFTIIPRSAPVWIGSEAKLKEWGVIQPEYGSNKKIAADSSGKVSSTTDGTIKVTYDEAVPTAVKAQPTSSSAIEIPEGTTGPVTGGGIGVSSDAGAPGDNAGSPETGAPNDTGAPGDNTGSPETGAPGNAGVPGDNAGSPETGAPLNGTVPSTGGAISFP